MGNSHEIRPRALTEEELESLKTDMHVVSTWMRAELRRRAERRRNTEMSDQAVTPVGG